MRRLLVPALAAVLGLGLTSAPPASAGPAVDEKPFPSRIDLPDGFQPEGIAVGPGATAWLGSLADGDIYRVSLRTGEGAVAFEGPGTPAVGLKRGPRGRLYVAGGSSGTARVLDTSTGVDTSYAPRRGVRQRCRADPRAPPGSPTRAFPVSTGSTAARVALLPPPRPSCRSPGSGQQGAGFGANGITTAPGGKALLVVNSGHGPALPGGPATGAATEVDLGGRLPRKRRRHAAARTAALRRPQPRQRGRRDPPRPHRPDRQSGCGPSPRPSSRCPPPSPASASGSTCPTPASASPTPTTADYWVTKVRGGRR